MKLRQRVLISLTSILGVGGIFTILLSELTRRDILQDDINVRRARHNLLSRQSPHEVPGTDSDAAREVIAASNQSLDMEYLGEMSSASIHRQIQRSHKVDDNLVKCNATIKNHFKDDSLFKLLSQLPSPSGMRRLTTSIGEVLGIDNEAKMNLSLVDKFYLKVTGREMYADDDDDLIDKVLHHISSVPIVNVVEKEGGTQLKLLITFEDGSQALMKPMRFDRGKQTEPNHFYFVDYERHTSEIAAFHLDRILGFRRTPPVVGRLLNITWEIYAVADDDLIKTFFISPARNLCFHGHCSHYCDTSHAICGSPDMLEGSLALLLPPKTLTSRKSWQNPWKRSYHKRRKTEWETNANFCDKVRTKPPYDHPCRLADVVDMSILDFLIGNMDRHHYETFQMFGNRSFIIHLDHGRGFGRPNHDETSILAPLSQCCFIRSSTLRRLLELNQSSKKLSQLMKDSLSKDPLNPILLDGHLCALDRRLTIVLETVVNCLVKHSLDEILYNDN